jgi:uncharacterized protein YxeA
MKKVILFILACIILTSCSFETYQCHSYGQTNNYTHRGVKSQGRYAAKHKI